MDEEDLKWMAGRDLALLRRCGNPETPQSETFSNVVLLRRLLVENAIHTYWNALRDVSIGPKFLIEYSSIAVKRIEVPAPFLFVLTGDVWSDLLVGGGLDEHGTAPKLSRDCHKGITLGPLNNHLGKSIVLAHHDFQFTPHDLILYHAYTLGDVHLSKAQINRVKAYDAMHRDAKGAMFSLKFGSNGPASLALKGVINRVVRSDPFRHMFGVLESGGYIPSDVKFPPIEPLGLQSDITQCSDFGIMSLLWTERATKKNMHLTHAAFPPGLTGSSKEIGSS